jgi:hypothetical protein
MNTKHTSELLEEFKLKLINRTKDLFEQLDNRKEDEMDEYNQILNKIINKEIRRIDKILKKLENN